ncbi:hypothetical protein ES703_90060 [subsurface metagenome]
MRSWMISLRLSVELALLFLCWCVLTVIHTLLSRAIEGLLQLLELVYERSLVVSEKIQALLVLKSALRRIFSGRT